MRKLTHVKNNFLIVKIRNVNTWLGREHDELFAVLSHWCSCMLPWITRYNGTRADWHLKSHLGGCSTSPTSQSQSAAILDPQLLTADFQSYVLALTETFKFDFNFYIFMMALFKSAMINIFNEENYFGWGQLGSETLVHLAMKDFWSKAVPQVWLFFYCTP